MLHWFQNVCQLPGLQHTIRLIGELDAEIKEIETAVQAIGDFFRYLRYDLYNAAKKLVQLTFALEKSKQPYSPAA